MVHRRQRMQSGLLAFSYMFMSVGQIFWQTLHILQLALTLSSTVMRNTETRLNNPSIAPRGQTARQKGRLMKTNKPKKTTRITTLTQKNQKMVGNIGSPDRGLAGFHRMKGIPASKFPWGQSLQNQGSWVKKGMINTKTTSTR